MNSTTDVRCVALAAQAILDATVSYDDRKQHCRRLTHPARVANNFESGSRSYVVALLHDVLEDAEDEVTETGKDELVAMITAFDAKYELGGVAILPDLERLTHKQSVSYDEYIKGILDYPDLMQIKYYDMLDNLQSEPTAWAVHKYGRTLQSIATRCMDTGMRITTTDFGLIATARR